MGRSGRKNQEGSGLRIGKDLQGVPRQLGDTDSSGKTVGFIDSSGNCWESVLEHDLVLTEGRYDDAVIEWERAGKESDPPDPLEIAKSVCIDRGNVEEAAAQATQNREMMARFRPPGGPFLDKDGEGWASVWDHDRTSTVDSFVDAMEEWEAGGRQGPRPDPRTFAEAECMDSENIARATEQAQEEWDVIFQRRAVSGVPLEAESSEGYKEGVAVYPGTVPGSQIEIIQEPSILGKGADKKVSEFIDKLRAQGIEVEERERDEFDELTEDLAIGEEISTWHSSFSYHVDALGHTVSLSTVRQSSREAYDAGRAIESRVMHGDLVSEEVEARVAVEGKTPEEQREEALQRLAQGPNRKDLVIMEALGLDKDALLRRDEAIASGRHVEQPFFLVEAKAFLPDLGQVDVLASGRSAEEALGHLQKVLPGARL